MIHESGSIPIPQLEGCSEGLYKTGDFYRKKGGARELLAKENNYFYSRTCFWGEEMGGVLLCRLLLTGQGRGGWGSGGLEGGGVGMKRAQATDYPTGGPENSRMADQDYISGEG